MAIDGNDTQSRIIGTPRSGRRARSLAPVFEAEGTSPPRSMNRQARVKPTADPVGKQSVIRSGSSGEAQPAQIGRYRVLSLIGCGGMGAVYACYDEHLDRKVAVKILRLESFHNQGQAAARLVREGQTLARLSHPNVVTVHEVGHADDQVYVAMEFIRGASFDAWTPTASSWKEVLAVFIQAGRGLEAAHRAGIVHRDFKPQNAIVGENGLVKVLDFGLARATGDQVQEDWFTTHADEEPSPSPLMRPLTRTGTLIGTPAYMSPEQHFGEPTTAASDQFSFCVSLYQCLYGLLPFSTTSFASLREDVLKGHILQAPLRSPVPARVFHVLRRGMAVDPGARWPSMSALIAVLERDPGATYRRAMILVASAAVTGAAGFAVASAQGSAIALCPDASAELAGVWDEARMQTVREAVKGTGMPRAEALLAVVEPQVARYVVEWTKMRNEACRAHAEGLYSENVFDLQIACLDQRRASLDALVDGLETTDAEGLEQFLQATAELPPLERCADTDALLAAIPPPEDRRLRTRVQTHRVSLARAAVSENTGQYHLGLQFVEAALADAQAIAHEPLRAEVYLHRGSLQMASGAFEAAEHSFNEAMLAALATGHAPVAAQASSKRNFLRGFHLSQLDRAKAELPEVTALNRRVERDIDLYAEHLNNVGFIHLRAGEFQDARRLLEAASDIRERHNREDTWKSIGTLANLAELAQLEGRFEDMESILRHVVSLSEHTLGTSHSMHIIHKVNLAWSFYLRGRPRAALESILLILDESELVESRRARLFAAQSAIEVALAGGDTALVRHRLVPALVASSAHPDEYDWYIQRVLMRTAAVEGDRAATGDFFRAAKDALGESVDPRDARYVRLLWGYGQGLARLGQLSDAVKSFEELRSNLADGRGVDDLSTASQVLADLGRLRRKLGDFDTAERELQQARRELDEVWPVRGPVHAEILLELGELALDRLRLDEAVEHLRAAESLFAATAEPDYPPLASTRFALARALVADPAAAGKYAEEALTAFLVGGKIEEAGAVKAWLAKPR